MKLRMNCKSKILGFAVSSASTSSRGIGISEMSYKILFNNICVGNMGRNGKKSEAPAMLNMLPKLELVPIMMYFKILPKVRRPSITPACTTSRFCSNKIMSAAALATSTAESTDNPTSAA